MPIAAGQLAPDFTLPTDTGESLTLSSLRGQWVVLYAYPKDDTSGCTTEACEFRDLFPKFKKGKSQALSDHFVGYGGNAGFHQGLR
jgi:peroxiredoxin Q/BCP